MVVAGGGCAGELDTGVLRSFGGPVSFMARWHVIGENGQEYGKLPIVFFDIWLYALFWFCSLVLDGLDLELQVVVVRRHVAVLNSMNKVQRNS